MITVTGQARSKRIPIYRLKLVRERTARFSSATIDTPKAAALFLCDLIGDRDREYFVALFLNAEALVIGAHVVAIGSLSGARLTPREVFKAGIHANAFSMVLGHNHPSGNVTPSPEDIRTTRHLMEAAVVLGIPIVDHVVVSTGGRFSSMHDLGLMESAGAPA